MKWSILTLLTCFTLSHAHASCQLKFGAVPQFDQRKLFSIWNPIMQEIGARTNCQVEIIGSKNIREFEKKFQSGTFDLAYMNPFHSVMAEKTQGYRSIIRSGAKKLKGILVVRNDFKGSLKNMAGGKIAFPSPNALGASLLMRAELKQKHQLNFEAKYVKTHNSVYLHVAKGLTVAGGGVGRTLGQQPEGLKKKLKVIYETAKVNAHPVVVHPRVGKKLIMTLQNAFLGLSKKRSDLFLKIPMKQPVKASNKDYLPLKEMGLEKFAEL